MKPYKNTKRGMAVSLSCCLAATGLMSLAGCEQEKDGADVIVDTGSETQESQTAMGRYLEEDVSLPEDCMIIDALQILDDGSLALLYKNQDYLARFTKSSDKGQTWEESVFVADLMGIPYDESGDSIMEIAAAKDGGIFAAVYVGGDEGYTDDFSMEYYYRSPDGAANKLDIQDIVNSIMITSCQFGDNGNIFLLSLGEGVKEINPKDGTLVHCFEEGGSVQFMGISGKNLAVVIDQTVHYYDIETGKPLETGDPLTQQITSKESNMQMVSSSSVPILFLSGDEEDSIFYLDHDGLYRYSFGGSVIEQVIDGALNSISSPSTGFTSAVRDEDSFYISSSDSSSGELKGKLCRYVYSKDTPTVPDTELKVYSLEDNSFIRQAAAVFQKKYPDIYLNLETGMSGDDAVTTTDALKTLNTEIMAGKGPDIMILDGIPSDTYIEKGMLEDLNGIFKEAGLLENIQNAYTREDGSIYTMPVQFGIPMIVGHAEDTDAITDLKSMADVIESHKDEYGVNENNLYSISLPSSFGAQMLLENLADSCSAAWIKEDGTLDEALIKDFLEQTGRIYQAGLEGLREIGELYGDDFVNQDWGGYDRSLSMAYSANEVRGNLFLLAAGAIYSPMDIAEIDSVQNLDSSISRKVWNAQAQNCFVPLNVVGVSSKSSEKEAAEKFVSFLFSDEGQQITRFVGYPVKQSVYDGDAYWDQGEPGTVLMTSSSYNAITGVDESFETIAPTQEIINEFKELGKSLTTPIADNEIILNAVSDAGVRYMNGEISLDEAANSVIQEVNLYLSE